MADPVTAATPATSTDTTDAQAAELAKAFQEALVKGGLIMLQSIQADVTEAFNDDTSNPDAPF